MTTELAAALAGLFASAFLAATLLPGGSEFALGTLVAHWPDRVALAVAVASIGNTLGGLTSFAIGRALPAPRAPGRAMDLARRHGVAVLLLSWVPVVGDALCVASGWLRHSWVAATAAIAAGKALRYLVIAESVRGFAVP